MRTILTFLFTVLISLASLQAQNRKAAFEINQQLGKGINMGNCFEAPTETEWSNPWKPEYFRMMSELGFRHVRIPVRWETAARSSAIPPYTIEASFLGRIRQVVDTALKYKLHAIINMHHHEAVFKDPDSQKARFLSQWEQIARYFRDYPDSLLFEVLNEPHDALTPIKWKAFFTDALEEIRKSNPNRFVLMGTPEWGGLGSLSTLQLPADERIILTIHYYNPFQFTHQGADWSEGASAWLGTVWQDTEAERETVRSEFRTATEFSAAQHIPIHIGEFGAYSKADMASRVRWTTFMARYFEEQSFSWAYWEFSAGFGIYNPTTRQLSTPLVNALLHNPMPAPTPVEVTPVYTSNFTTGNDGWSLNTQGGAAGSLARTGGKLTITLTSGGIEGWHAQLIRGNLPLVKGKKYQITLKVSATASRPATVYIGKSGGDWGSYSGYNTFTFNTQEQGFVFTFTMSGENDNTARMVFDLGKNTTGITLTSVKIEEERVITAAREMKNPAIRIYPNPADGRLFIGNYPGKARAEILTLAGQTVHTLDVEGEVVSTDIGHLPRGTYLLVIRGEKSTESHKIIIL